MTSIGSLPPEILREIFLVCPYQSAVFPEDDPDISGQQYCEPSPNTSPLLLTQICSNWRYIALGTPQLWSSLALEWTQANVNSNAAICDFWLPRSRNLPLALYMKEIIVFRKDTHLVSSQVLKAILPFKHRWKHLQLGIHQSGTFAAILDDDFSFPQLESLRLNSAFMNETKWFMPEKCPNLRRLALGPGCSSSELRRRLAGSITPRRLTHLAILFQWICKEAVIVLQECTNLVFLQANFYNSESDSNSSFQYPTITLPLLRELHVRRTYNSDLINRFLGALTLRNLNSFSYDERSAWKQTISTRVIIGLIKRLRPPLRTLKLSLESLPTDAEVIKLLQLVPQLSQLELVAGFHMHRRFGDTLASTMAHFAIVPHLESLTVRSELAVSEQNLIELFTKRDKLKAYITMDNPSPKLKAFFDAQQERIHDSRNF